MARARMLNPKFFTNEELGQLPPLARLLFSGLWSVADREGRLEDRPRRLKVQLLPYDDADVGALLDQLQEAGFIIRYEADGGRWIQVITFLDHQHPHPHEPPSVIPKPGEPRHVIRSPDMPRPDRESKAESITESESESSASLDHPTDDLSQRPPTAAFPDAVAAFLAADPKQRVGRLVDLGDALKFKRNGGFCAAIVKEFGHGQRVVDAMVSALSARGDPWEYVKASLTNEEVKRGHARSGRQGGAVPPGGAEGFSSVSGAEVSKALKAKADEAARTGKGTDP